MNLHGCYFSNWRVFGFLLAVALLVAQPACAQGSANVALANLNHLVDNAQIIVRGNVVSATLEPHPQFANLQTVVVTIAVAKTFKGQVTPTFTFRQFVWDIRDATSPGGYHKSDELLLFLNPTSLYGLTSPVGMEQGRFRVLRDDRGNRFAVNGRGNIGLFVDVVTESAGRSVTFSSQARSMLSKNAGQVSLGTLEETIQVLVAARP
jgi:hypothetical protein